MLFNSFIFFLFLAIVMPVFIMLRTKESKNTFLLGASYVFYGYWDWRFCILLLITTILDFYISRGIANNKQQTGRKKLLITSLIINLGVLAFFKYFNFFVSSLNDLALALGTKTDFLHLNILLPVGLSFYIFHNISYIVDVYNNKITPAKSIVDFGLFVAFFPQLVAGPIGRASMLMPQFEKKLQPTKEQIQQGIVLIITGLFRKVMIGDTTGRFVDHIFNDLDAYKSLEIICAILLFSVQIYADFSGYSHIARGTSKLFGIELMKNFEQPYLSQSITEFWRRWHISLSSWLRDYLYIPLGGNRKGLNKTYINLFITMLLGGLWHGASWNFVIWGALHGIYLAADKLFNKNKKEIDAKNVFRLTIIPKILFTNLLVVFAWIFFRSTNWQSTQLIFSKMVHWQQSEFSSWFILTTLTYILFILVLDLIEYKTGKHTFWMNIQPKALQYGILSALFLFTLCYMYQTKPAPFMYFQF